MPDASTHYEILEIAETASDEQIKKAYQRLAQAYHPDKVPSHLSEIKQDVEEKLKQIIEAYKVLIDPDKRRQYDDLLMDYREEEQKSASYNNQPYSQPTSSSFPQLEVNKRTFEFLNIRKNSHVSDSFTISNVGGGVLSGVITINGKKWLTVSQSNIDTTRHKQDISFHVNTSGLAFGFRDTGTIEIQSNGGAENVNVTISIEAARKRRNKYIGLGVGLSVIIYIIVTSTIGSVGKKNAKHSQSTPNQKESNLPSPTYRELPFPQRYVQDRANIISDAIEKDINGYLRELEQKTDAQMIVLAINTTGSIPIETYAVEFAAEWKLGQKGKEIGVLIVIAKDDRAYRIEIGRGLEKILPDNFCGTVAKTYFAPNFQKGQFSEGIYQCVVTIGNKIYESRKDTDVPDNFKHQSKFKELTAVSLDKLTANTRDADLFENRTKDLQMNYDAAWNAVEKALKDQREKLRWSDKENGLLITESTAHFGLGGYSYDQYFIVLERSGDITSKLSFKLFRYYADKDGSLKPENKPFIENRAKKFLDNVNKAATKKK